MSAFHAIRESDCMQSGTDCGDNARFSTDGPDNIKSRSIFNFLYFIPCAAFHIVQQILNIRVILPVVIRGFLTDGRVHLVEHEVAAEVEHGRFILIHDLLYRFIFTDNCILKTFRKQLIDTQFICFISRRFYVLV